MKHIDCVLSTAYNSLFTMLRKSYSHLLTVALIWALELFAFQALSFHFDYPVPLVKRVGAQVVRLLLDLTFSLGFVLLLPRILTLFGFLLFIVCSQGLSYYQEVFGRVLSWKTLTGQFAEGLEVLRFDGSCLNWWLLLAMLAVLLLKWRLLKLADVSKPVKRASSSAGTKTTALLNFLRHNRRFPAARAHKPPNTEPQNVEVKTACKGLNTVAADAPAYRRRLALGAASLLLYALLLTVAMLRIDRPDKLRTFVSADRFGMTYGFLPLWACEFRYLDEEHLVREAVARRSQATDRLSAIEQPITLTGDVILIQVESLDWRALHQRVDGRLVMPFLNRLSEEAMLFRITPVHENGSGDTDFVMLNAVPPSPTVMTYKFNAYPYRETLPQLATRAGYIPVALHGNSGVFFERKRNFDRMGFKRTFFLEEMRAEAGMQAGRWGIRDDQVFSLSGQLLERRTSGERQLHYIITLTSHQPFIYLEPEQCLFRPQRDDIQSRYFNSVNFVDRQLEAYIGGLRQDTLVVIFGDHRALVEYPSEVEADGERAEFVPLLIHRMGERLAGQQRSRDQPISLSGELTLLDAAAYIHGWFRPAE
ncbi:MAG: LTA synthase family protein [Kiritimatiellae bacterium]|nr:LTA synthase family protein [Kiritimatiellia bacterium]